MFVFKELQPIPTLVSSDAMILLKTLDSCLEIKGLLWFLDSVTPAVER